MSVILEQFEAQRGNIIGLAYRITGSVFEAEDIAHETYLKWADADHQDIRNPKGWLMQVATRKALDYAKSAAVRRQDYKGPWLPEPLIADEKIPENEHEMDESVTMALLLLLDQLSPGERAAFILHDLFHFDFSEIGEMLGKSVAACRKLASRARRKIDQGSVRRQTDKREHDEIVTAFFGAVKQGNIDKLTSLLSETAVFHSDGGGKAAASLRILAGKGGVINFLIKAVKPSFARLEQGELRIESVWFNGLPGFVLWEGASPVTAFNFDIVGDEISKIYALRNPDKLKLFTRASGKESVSGDAGTLETGPTRNRSPAQTSRRALTPD